LKRWSSAYILQVVVSFSICSCLVKQSTMTRICYFMWTWTVCASVL
jgi:hypothetical protein